MEEHDTEGVKVSVERVLTVPLANLRVAFEQPSGQRQNERMRTPITASVVIAVVGDDTTNLDLS